MELLDKIRSRKARTGVIGLGYVGLPLAIEFAHAGFRAVGIDVDQRKVDAVNGGTSYIVDTASEEVASLVATGRLSATNDFAVFRKYVVDFCTDSRPVKKYAPNDGDPRGYGWGYLAHEAKDDKIPATIFSNKLSASC